MNEIPLATDISNLPVVPVIVRNQPIEVSVKNPPAIPDLPLFKNPGAQPGVAVKVATYAVQQGWNYSVVEIDLEVTNAERITAALNGNGGSELTAVAVYGRRMIAFFKQPHLVSA